MCEPVVQVIACCFPLRVRHGSGELEAGCGVGKWYQADPLSSVWCLLWPGGDTMLSGFQTPLGDNFWEVADGDQDTVIEDGNSVPGVIDIGPDETDEVVIGQGRKVGRGIEGPVAGLACDLDKRVASVLRGTVALTAASAAGRR